MSTYWYFFCNDCHEWSGVVGRSSVSLPTPGIQDFDGQTGKWLYRHHRHSVGFYDEYERYPESPPWVMDVTPNTSPPQSEPTSTG